MNPGDGRGTETIKRFSSRSRMVAFLVAASSLLWYLAHIFI